MKQRTSKERVFNEATGCYEIREVKLKNYCSKDDDRIMLVREYIESGFLQ